MSMYPEENCLLCDLPWKNNRVRYDGRLTLDYRSRQLMLGRDTLTIDAEGVIRFKDTVIRTGFSANNSSIAMDSLYRRLYFASNNRMIAFDLEERCTAFICETQGYSGAPLLFEWLYPDGGICPALGFSDGTEHYFVLERVTGQMLWCAQILSTPVDNAAHWNGYLYLTIEGMPCQVLCLESKTGDVVWWNHGTGEARGGVVCNERYCVLNKEGIWQQYSLFDGERLA